MVISCPTVCHTWRIDPLLISLSKLKQPYAFILTAIYKSTKLTRLNKFKSHYSNKTISMTTKQSPSADEHQKTRFKPL